MEIQELLERYKVVDGVDDTLCKTYVGSTPVFVGLRILTTTKLPSTSVPTIMKIKDNVVVKGHWKDLLRHRYFYRLLEVSPIGLKIVKNDLDKHGRGA